MRNSKKKINRFTMRAVKKVMLGAAVLLCMNQICISGVISPWSSAYAAEFDMDREKERMQSQIQIMRFLLEEIKEWEKPIQEYAEYQNKIWADMEDVIIRRIQHTEELLQAGSLTDRDIQSVDEYFGDATVFAKIELNSRKAAYFLEMTEQESELAKKIQKEFTFSDESSYASIEGESLKIFYRDTLAPVVADMEAAMEDLLEDSQKYFPHIVESYTIEAGQTLEAKDLVVNHNTLPDSVEYSFKNEPDTSEEGLTEAEVVVQYADDSAYFKPVLIRIKPKEAISDDIVEGEQAQQDMSGETEATASDAGKKAGDDGQRATGSDAAQAEKADDAKKSESKKRDTGGTGTTRRSNNSQTVSRTSTAQRYPLQDGWTKRGNTWYFVRNRAYATGWILDNNQWYYLDAFGKMQTSWIEYQGKWYYLHADGSMAKSTWIQSPSTKKWYYLKDNGMMATNERIGIYQVDESGAWVE